MQLIRPNVRRFIHILIVTLISLLPGLAPKLNAEPLPRSLQYLYPAPGATHISEQSTIILRFSIAKEPVNTVNHRLTVEGSEHGPYTGKSFLAGDRRSLLFKPDLFFRPGETITVTICSPHLPDNCFIYKFQISPITRAEEKQFHDTYDRHKNKPALPRAGPTEAGEVRTIGRVTVPSDFPQLDILENKAGKAPGKLFFGLRERYIIILNEDGSPYFYRRSNDFLMDFKVQPNGQLSRNVDDRDTNEHFCVTLDRQFNNVDTFAVGFGYHTDHHDFQLLPNGHSLLIANEHRTIDMSKVVSGGQKNAIVLGHHIQELDQNKNVIFNFSGFDKLNIVDAIHENLRSNSFDYAHINSVNLDFDGHILASCRNLSACIKIHRQTGEIIWTLGGMQNDFTFINSTDQNSYQHNFYAVPGKPCHYTLFDNGNYHIPRYTRAVEFKLDTILMTAEKVWEYRKSPDFRVDWLGNIQRLPNGNSLICWSGGGYPLATEVTPEGELVFETQASPYLTYRSYRFDWVGMADRPYLITETYEDQITLIFNKFGDDNLDHYRIYTGGTIWSMNLFDTTSQSRYDLRKVENKSHYFILVTAVDDAGHESVPSETKHIYTDYYEAGENIVENGNFDSHIKDWQLITNGSAQADAIHQNGSYLVDIGNPGTSFRHIQVVQMKDIPIYQGKQYRFQFSASADNPRTIEAIVMKKDLPYTDYGKIGPTYITRQQKQYTYTFVMEDRTDPEARIVFYCGADSADVTLDDISLIIEDTAGLRDGFDRSQPDFELGPNYPNPFNATTRIPFTLRHHGDVHLDIFNLAGCKVWDTQCRNICPGHHYVPFDGTSLASGVYIYRIQFVDSRKKQIQSASHKMVLMK